MCLKLFVCICLQDLVITLQKIPMNQNAVLGSPVVMYLQQNSLHTAQESVRKTGWKHFKSPPEEQCVCYKTCFWEMSEVTSMKSHQSISLHMTWMRTIPDGNADVKRRKAVKASTKTKNYRQPGMLGAGKK